MKMSQIFPDKRPSCSYLRPTAFNASHLTRSSNVYRKDLAVFSRGASPGNLTQNMQNTQAASTSSTPTTGSQEKPPQNLKQGSRGLTYTTYEANAWQATFSKSGVTILVDPWLIGELVFYGQEWAFKGRKGCVQPLDIDAIAGKADVIVLSQGLPDHAHKPTLARLPKQKTIVCSPSAAKIASELGFKNIYELDHGRSMDFAEGRLNIRATAGALVGPPWSKRENGFIFRETVPQGISVYYEPHCDYVEDSFSDIDSVDIVITPVIDQIIAGYALVTGKRKSMGLIKRLKPKAVVPFINAGFPSEGPLSQAIREDGDVSSFENELRQEGYDMVVKLPTEPGKTLQVSIEST